MTRRRSIGAATLLAVLSIAACDGSDGSSPAGTGTNTGGKSSGTSSSADTSTGSLTSSSGSGNSTTGASTDGDGDGEDGFSYVPWGPDDPPIPGQFAALAASPDSPPNCDDLAANQPDGDFWATALDVCRAITEDRPWPERTTAPAPPQALNAYQACLDKELAAMLDQALRWHAKYPDRRPRVSYPGDSTTSPCQARIYEVRVLGQDDLDPGEDYPRERIGLAITASALDRPFTVTVDGQTPEPTRDFLVDQPPGGEEQIATVVVLVPAAAQPRTAKIEVSTFRDTLEATVDLPGTDGSSSPAETGDPEPSKTDPSGAGPQPSPSPNETAS